MLDIATSGRPDVQIDDASLPPVTISEEARQAYDEVSDQRARNIARDVLAGLEIEADALRTRDPVLAATASSRARLTSIEAQITDAGLNGEIVVPTYTVASMEIVMVDPGFQFRPLLGVAVQGTAREVTYGGPDDTIVSETESRFGSVFVVAETEDGYYVIVDEVPVT